MKFSVIIPCYNKAEVISLTLNSVLQQTYDNYEILVIDDGSKDDSANIVKSIGHPQIRLIRQDNAGVSSARNTGIKNAEGDWIAFLDADDWWHPNYLEHLSKVYERNPAAKAIAAAFFCLPDQPHWQPSNWDTPIEPSIEIIDNLYTSWLKEIPFFTSSISLKKSFLNKHKIKFAVGESTGEDLDVWFRSSEITPIYRVKDELVVYRTEQKDSLSSGTSSISDSLAFHLTQLKKRIDGKQIPKNLIQSSKKLIAHAYLTQSRELIVSGNRALSIKCIMSAIQEIGSKRWWVSLFMVLLIPSSYVKKWNEKRTGRKELSA